MRIATRTDERPHRESGGSSSSSHGSRTKPTLSDTQSRETIARYQNPTPHPPARPPANFVPLQRPLGLFRHNLRATPRAGDGGNNKPPAGGSRRLGAARLDSRLAPLRPRRRWTRGTPGPGGGSGRRPPPEGRAGGRAGERAQKTRQNERHKKKKKQQQHNIIIWHTKNQQILRRTNKPLRVHYYYIPRVMRAEKKSDFSNNSRGGSLVIRPPSTDTHTHTSLSLFR